MNLIIIGLQALLFYLLPVIIGRGIFLVWKRKAEEISVVGYFTLGTLVVFGWAMGLRYMLGLVGDDFVKIFFPGVWVMILIALVANAIRKPEITRLTLMTLAGIMLLSGVSFGIWSFRNPYPLNWDWYQHQQLARLVQQGEISFFTSEMSDTFGFNSYPPIFHTLLAIAQYPYQLTPKYLLDYWQVLSYWHLVTVGLVAYGLGLGIAKSKEVGWLMALMSVFIFDSHVSLTTYFFLPQTLAAVLFTGLMARLFRVTQISWIEVASGVMVLILMHYLVGGVAALIYLGTAVYLALGKRMVKEFPLGTFLTLIAVAGVILASKIPVLQLNQGEAQLYVFSFEKIQEAVERSFGYLPYLLVPVGIGSLMVGKLQARGLTLMIAFGLGMIVISQLPYALKLMSLWRFWLIVLMVLGLGEFTKIMHFRIFKLVLGVIVGLGLSLILMMNLMYWRAGIMAEGVYTHITSQDITAATWVFETYQGKQVNLVSDPATQFILEGLAGVDSVGGAYMPLAKRQRLVQALTSGSAENLVNMTRMMVGGETEQLLVFSGRTAVWARMAEKDWSSYGYNVWSPVRMSVKDVEFGEEIKRVDGVTQVFANPSLIIFQI